MNILLTFLLIIRATADNEGRTDNRVGFMFTKVLITYNRIVFYLPSGIGHLLIIDIRYGSNLDVLKVS